jgi:pimeloyl-ACP methyl ester carboxylesterase
MLIRAGRHDNDPMNVRGTVLRVAATALLSFACGAHAAESKPPTIPAFTLQSARDIIAESRKIVSPNGIQVLLDIPVNGTRQWLSIRGNDNRNPILLFLHGGPASPDMPLAYTFQTPWEDYFTVVQWDQRGAGKTFAANDPARIGPTLTVDQMTDDAEQVVRYLLETYHKRKIFLIGHSWGSVLGVALAQRHPEWFHAYIGVGQVVDMHESEMKGYAFAVQQANEHHDAKAIRELTAIAPYPGDGPLELKKLDVQRQWLSYYGGLAYGRTSFAFDANAEQLAPEYSDRDLDAIDRGSKLSLQHLLGSLAIVNFGDTTQFGCPMLLFLGRHDYEVSQSLAAKWFATIKAPSKRLVWFEDSAHMVMQEQPGRFLQHLVDDARPFAVQAGDAVPDDVVIDR